MNIAVGQSGGPTCAINSSLAGVIAQAAKQKEIDTVYGARNGIDGIIDDRLVNLTETVDTQEKLELLRLTPSTALGSCRIKLPHYENNPSVYDVIFANLKKYDIGAFFYIGGNDSMDTVEKLSAYARVIGSDIRFVGIPKTIDNDLPVTDHTPGFGSAAKFIATAVKEITCDSRVYNQPSVTVIEIMGRDAGWLTASTVLLKDNADAPHLIYLPERPFSVEQFIDDIKAEQRTHKAVIVAVSEGIRAADGHYAAEGDMSGKTDVFGHKYLAGAGKYLENVVTERIGCKVRSVELNVCQRCSAHLASQTDLDEAFAVAAEGVRAALNGKTGVIMTIRRVSDEPYSVVYEPAGIAEVANKEKKFPDKWINAQGNGILPEAVGYFLPLIKGEVKTVYKGGIAEHFVI